MKALQGRSFPPLPTGMRLFHRAMHLYLICLDLSKHPEQDRTVFANLEILASLANAALDTPGLMTASEEARAVERLHSLSYIDHPADLTPLLDEVRLGLIQHNLYLRTLALCVQLRLKMREVGFKEIAELQGRISHLNTSSVQAIHHALTVLAQKTLNPTELKTQLKKILQLAA